MNDRIARVVTPSRRDFRMSAGTTRWQATERFRFFGREAVETFFLGPLPCLMLGRSRKDDRLRRAGLPGCWRGRTPVIVEEIQRWGLEV
jgi:hypothetical protein